LTTEDARPQDQQDPALDQALARVRAATDDHAHAVTQTGFQTYAATGYYAMSDRLPLDVPVIAELPYRVADQVITAVSVSALRTGATVFAALARNPEDGRSTTAQDIGYSELYAALRTAPSEETEIGKAWAAAQAQMEQLPTILLMAAQGLAGSLLELDSRLMDDADALGSWVLEFLHRGAAAEFCLTRLLAEDAEGASILPRIVAAVTGSPDIGDPANVAAFEEAVGLPDSILPWPLDERCECGRSLSAAIYCCDPAQLIDLREHHRDLGPDFELARACCGDSMRGFRCDACGRLYSWLAGVAPSLAPPV
jgi:hypothetical protein